MTEPIGLIYSAINLVNQKRYIGQTTKKNYIKYFKQHVNRALNNDVPNKLFYKSIRKYGRSNFLWTVICFCYSIEELHDKEIYWISYFDTTNQEKGYNLAFGGEGGNFWINLSEERKNEIRSKISNTIKGVKKGPMSLKHRQNVSIGKTGCKSWNKGLKCPQMSVVKKGVLNPMFGKGHLLKGRIHSEETRKKISQSLIGKSGKSFPKTEAQKNKARIQMLDKWKDPEYRKMQSDSHKGKIQSIESKRKVSEAVKQYLLNPENKAKRIAQLRSSKIKS